MLCVLRFRILRRSPLTDADHQLLLQRRQTETNSHSSQITNTHTYTHTHTHTHKTSFSWKCCFIPTLNKNCGQMLYIATCNTPLTLLFCEIRCRAGSESEVTMAKPEVKTVTWQGQSHGDYVTDTESDGQSHIHVSKLQKNAFQLMEMQHLCTHTFSQSDTSDLFVVSAINNGDLWLTQ